MRCDSCYCVDNDLIKIKTLQENCKWLEKTNGKEILSVMPFTFTLGSLCAFAVLAGDGTAPYDYAVSISTGVISSVLAGGGIHLINSAIYFKNKRKIHAVLKQRPDLQQKYDEMNK